MIFDVCVDELLMMKISISFFLIYELMKIFSSLWWRTRVEESLEDFWCFGGGRKFYDYGGEDTKIIKGTTKYY